MEPRQCQCCGIIERGKLLSEALTEYRGYLICSFCIGSWQDMEREKGGEVKFLRLKWRGGKIPSGRR